MSADKRPCQHDKAQDPEPMTLLEHRLGYRVVGDPRQLQNLDSKGHVESVRPASGVELQLFGLLTSGTLGT